MLPASMTLPAAQRMGLYSPCSCSYRSSSSVGLVGCRGRPRRLSVKAQEGEQPPQQSEPDREGILEALEAQARARKGTKSIELEKQRPKPSQVAAQKGTWKEGQLLPEGWDEMDVPTKLYQLYMGERGLMFWANKAALASVFILIGGWIVFRFVGPALGLYTLASDFSQPNYM